MTEDLRHTDATNPQLARLVELAFENFKIGDYTRAAAFYHEAADLSAHPRMKLLLRTNAHVCKRTDDKEKR